MNTDITGSYAYSSSLQGVYYGPGSLSTKLPIILDKFKINKAIIVTGKSLYTKTDIVRKVETLLAERDAHAGSLYEIGQHTPVAGINAGVQLLNESRADAIISVGGGSPIDATKAIIYRHREGNPSDAKHIYHIAIPTTLSAAEYTTGAGYTNDEGNKVSISGPNLTPSAIILDAELTLLTPERLWLSTGLRALDHAVENLYRPLVPLPVKVLCHAAIADLFKYLPLSKQNPQDVSVRQKLQIASWMSLWPLQLEKYASLGLSHALGQKLGATYSIPHGITSCLTLAPVVALKATIASESDKEFLAQSLFHLRVNSTGTVEQDILLLSSMIKNLVIELGLKSTLKEYDVLKSDLKGIAERALGDPNHPNVDGVSRVLESIYE